MHRTVLRALQALGKYVWDEEREKGKEVKRKEEDKGREGRNLAA